MTDQNMIYFMIAIIGIVFTILSFAIGRNTASKTEGKADGTITSDLGYLKSSVDAIGRRLDLADARDRDYIMRLTIVEQSAKSAHNRLDEYCAKITKHEAI